MKTAIHPAMFLCGAIAISGAWLWLRPAPERSPLEVRALTAPAGAPQPAPSPPSVRVDPATLERYAGKYKVDDLVIEIRVTNGRLIAATEEAGSFDLVAASDTRFLFQSFPGEVTFDDDGDGPSQRFVADLANGRLIAKRLPE